VFHKLHALWQSAAPLEKGSHLIGLNTSPLNNSEIRHTGRSHYDARLENPAIGAAVAVCFRAIIAVCYESREVNHDDIVSLKRHMVRCVLGL